MYFMYLQSDYKIVKKLNTMTLNTTFWKRYLYNASKYLNLKSCFTF